MYSRLIRGVQGGNELSDDRDIAEPKYSFGSGSPSINLIIWPKVVAFGWQTVCLLN